MKLLVIGPSQGAIAESPAARARQELQAGQVERYVVYTPRAGESKFAAAQRMLRESTKEDFDTVSSQDPFFAGFVAWRIARRKGARLNVQVHADLDAQSLVRHVLAQIVLRHADSIRVVSQRIKAQVEKIGVSAKISVLPIYIDIEKFRAVAPQPHAQKTILWIGRFESEKDPLYAIKVLKEVRKTVDAKLVMLGDGSLMSEVQKKAAGLLVELPGWDDLLKYLPLADVVLCTSHNESWGASIIEALAAGVPVVAPDVGIAREAGAIVVPKKELARAVAQTLATGARGELKLVLPPAFEWAQLWKNTF